METVLRIRPQSEHSIPYLTVIDEQKVHLIAPPESHAFKNTKHIQETYTFTKVLPHDASQITTFETAALPHVRSLLNQQDGLIFAMGVTGSGKSHTMFGTNDESGVTQLSLAVLFSSLDVDVTINDDETDVATVLGKRSRVAARSFGLLPMRYIRSLVEARIPARVIISFVELYNDKFYDLLNPSSGPLTLKSGDRKYVAGCRKVVTANLNEAAHLIEYGRSQRRNFATNANASSSRSHAILTIRLETDTTSELSIIDLAGSERVRATGTRGTQLQEAGSINLSLMTLGQCLEILKSKHTKVFPSRQSKLTELLFDARFFNDSKRVSMLVCIDGSTFYDENAQILKYASHAREITIRKDEIHQDVPDRITQLELEVDEWRDKYHDAIQQLSTLETSIREEMADIMDSTINAIERRHREQLSELVDMHTTSTDKKIDLLQTDSSLKAENERLKRQLAYLRGKENVAPAMN